MLAAVTGFVVMDVLVVFPPELVAVTDSKIYFFTTDDGTTRSTESKPLISAQFGVGAAATAVVTAAEHAYQR